MVQTIEPLTDSPELSKIVKQLNESNPETMRPNSNSFQFYLAIIFSCFGGFLFGYDTGVISGAMLLMKPRFNLTVFEQSMIVSVTIVGAWIFSLISGYSADRFGRKPVILISAVIFTIGSLTMGLASSASFLIVGRFILGIAIGLSSSTIAVYISEITQYRQRGTFVTTYNSLITGGQFIAGVVAGLFSTTNDGWRHMINLGAIPSALQAIYFLWAPESPRFLLKVGKEKEAFRNLRSLRGDEEATQIEFEQIKMHVQSQENETTKGAGVLDVLKRVRVDVALRRALVLGCTLQIIQQLSGINVAMYYSGTIIQQAGIENESQAIWLASLTGLFNFLFTFVGLVGTDRVGRRKLILGSLIGVCVSLLFLSGSFYAARYTTPAVTEVADINSTCSQMANCNSCVSRPECGFCFTKGGEEFRSTCLPVDENDQYHSLGGWCEAVDSNHYQLPNNLTFAVNNCPSSSAYLILGFLLFYLALFASGLGSQPWVIGSEIFPLPVRTACFSLTVACNWLSNTFISMTFLPFIQLLTESGTFLIYFFCSLAGLVYFWRHLPETRGKTLEEIEQLFRSEEGESNQRTAQKNNSC